jgi:D-alanyl-D-alanine carboxypeptidase (penicillin-binding protein 5/6)
VYLSTSGFYVAVVLAYVLVLGDPVSAAPAPVSVGCHACLVVDDTGRILFARHADEPVAIASATKMVTSLVVVAEADLDASVRVSGTAAAVGMGGLDLQAGDVYTVEELLFALLMTSSNEAAVALAEHVAGAEPSFVALMNRRVDRLEAEDTHFVNAHGLDEPGHRSTASDLAVIAAEVLDHPLLARIVRTTDASIGGPGLHEALENRNPLLETYRGAVGVKTGYTVAAGNVLVAAASRRDRTVVTVALGSQDAVDDSRRLLDYGFARLRRTVIVGAGTTLGTLVFDPSGATGAATAQAVRGLAAPADVDAQLVVNEDLRPPVASGQPIGTIIVSASGRTVATIDALATSSVDASEPSWFARLLAMILSAIGRVVGEPAGA